MSFSILSCPSANPVNVPSIGTRHNKPFPWRGSFGRRWVINNRIQKLNCFEGQRLSFGSSLLSSYSPLSFHKKGKLATHATDEENSLADYVDEAEKEARKTSTLPDRFRNLTKEAPDRAVRWPWLIAVVFLLYAWRTVLWELANWKKLVLIIPQFLKYLSKLLLAFIFHFAGDLITGSIWVVETVLYTLRSIYFSVVAAAPVQELTIVILLTSSVLAIAEAVVPDSVSGQPYLLTVAGFVGFGAVKGFLPEVTFWLLLVGMFCFSRFVGKRDVVSATLPVASLLVAIGQPWVRALVMLSYTALAITQHSRSVRGKDGVEDLPAIGRQPIPLLIAALAIGIHVAAKWTRYRHLTWMIA
ncbi:hypothetical protein EJ110_NYTH29773 [Nymphaea thermarum]|nr:hypothetical protein EJ110_NYTH29773 [Nymphaea thermarum]